jgi:hypothetical protein
MSNVIQFPVPPQKPEGVVVVASEVPSTAMPSGHDLTPPTANRFAHIESTPKRRRKPRPKMRVEQHEVTCTRVPRKRHHDLRSLSGVLTLDFKGEVPWTATFDPDDEVPNIEAPIEKLSVRDGRFEVTTDEGLWVFDTIIEEG